MPKLSITLAKHTFFSYIFDVIRTQEYKNSSSDVVVWSPIWRYDVEVRNKFLLESQLDGLVISKWVNSIFLKFFSRALILAWNSPLTWFTIRCESMKKFRILTPKWIAMSRSEMHASYSAWLFDILKLNVIACSTIISFSHLRASSSLLRILLMGKLVLTTILGA